MKNGEIILCKGIKMDKGFENVLSYNESDMVTLCRNNAVATTTKYSILDPSVRSIDVALPYGTCIPVNYIAFKNPYYGNKWYFGFVEDIVYINNNTTTIKYKLDVFSTWYSSMNVGKAFVEREHVSDDTFGLHTIPEKLNTGDFIINGTDIFDEFQSTTYIVMGVTGVPESIGSVLYGSSVPYNAPNTIYNGIFGGLKYIAFQTSTSASQFLGVMDIEGKSDNVVSIFLVPSSMLTITQSQWKQCPWTYEWGSIKFNWTFTYYLVPNKNNPSDPDEAILFDNKTVTMNNTLDGYTPKNNKMFTKEFNHLYITNNSGGEIVYAYEDFKDHLPSFKAVGSICPGCSIRLLPRQYKKYENTTSNNILLSYGLAGAKYPTCSWRCDAYTNWMTQNGVNGTFLQNLGVATTIAGGAILAPDTFGVSAVNSIGNVMLETDENRKLKHPMQAKGNVNVGDVTFSCGLNTFQYFQLSCKYEYAKICDDYLSRFGYRINEIKTPNLNSRSKFNFIKIGGADELITGDIPASDLEEINNIFRKGVTIFHDYTTFGDYTQTNSIV